MSEITWKETEQYWGEPDGSTWRWDATDAEGKHLGHIIVPPYPHQQKGCGIRAEMVVEGAREVLLFDELRHAKSWVEGLIEWCDAPYCKRY